MKFSWDAISVAGNCTWIQLIPRTNLQQPLFLRTEFLLGDQAGTNIPPLTIEEALRNVLREWGGGRFTHHFILPVSLKSNRTIHTR